MIFAVRDSTSKKILYFSDEPDCIKYFKKHKNNTELIQCANHYNSNRPNTCLVIGRNGITNNDLAFELIKSKIQKYNPRSIKIFRKRWFTIQIPISRNEYPYYDIHFSVLPNKAICVEASSSIRFKPRILAKIGIHYQYYNGQRQTLGNLSLTNQDFTRKSEIKAIFDNLSTDFAHYITQNNYINPVTIKSQEFQEFVYDYNPTILLKNNFKPYLIPEIKEKISGLIQLQDLSL